VQGLAQSINILLQPETVAGTIVLNTISMILGLGLFFSSIYATVIISKAYDRGFASTSGVGDRDITTPEADRTVAHPMVGPSQSHVAVPEHSSSG
jgi:hypothetical protein